MVDMNPGNQPEPARSLDGAKVLIVEDNFLVATQLASQLRAMGCEVLGPVATIDEGMGMLERGGIDLAVLDINIIGGTSAPIAFALESRHVPFLFVTGYGSPKLLPATLKSRRRLNKPVNDRVLRAALIDAISAAA